MAATSSSLKCSAVIVAAGSSRRMGFDKLAADLSGMPVLRRTLEVFAAADCVDVIIVVCPEERWLGLGPEDFPENIRRVDGGKDRQDSVVNGLAALSDGARYVAVHDGARPLVDAGDVSRCLAAAAEHRAAALARRVTETLKRSDESDFSLEPVSRERLWFMETPQVFETGLLREAYAAVVSRGLAVTDEVSAVESIGVRVKLVESTHPNLKITTPADLVLAAAILASR